MSPGRGKRVYRIFGMDQDEIEPPAALDNAEDAEKFKMTFSVPCDRVQPVRNPFNPKYKASKSSASAISAFSSQRAVHSYCRYP